MECEEESVFGQPGSGSFTDSQLATNRLPQPVGLSSSANATPEKESTTAATTPPPLAGSQETPQRPQLQSDTTNVGGSGGASPPSAFSGRPSPNRHKSSGGGGGCHDMDEEEQLFINEWGFEINEKERKREEVYIKSIDGAQVLRREIKWANMTADWSATSHKMMEKLKERCRKGIPSKLRGIAWQYLLGSRREMEDPANQGVYDALRRKKVDPEVAGIIERDLGRTFPTHVLFRDQDGLGQTQLRNILRAYANIDPEVAYVQGMGFLVGALMTQMEEEEAFWALHSLMHHERYRLRDMYRPGFPMLQLFFFQLKKLMQEQIPKLFNRFEEIGVDPSFFASQWFLTLFVYHFQFRALLRVWDIFFCEGWKQIFRVAIALMKWEERELLVLPFDQVLPRLKLLHEGKNPDEILTRSLKVKFKTEELARWRKEYEEQLRSSHQAAR